MAKKPKKRRLNSASNPAFAYAQVIAGKVFCNDCGQLRKQVVHVTSAIGRRRCTCRVCHRKIGELFED